MSQWTKEDYDKAAEAGEYRDNALEDIVNERLRQLHIKHGGDTYEFDKTNSRNDWVAYIVAYAGRASDKCARNEKDGQKFRENMVKVAALALAAIEATDKKWC